MKRFIALFLALMTAASAAVMSSCSDEKKQTKPTEASSAPATSPATVEETTAPEPHETVINTKAGSLDEFYASTLTGDCPLYGVWELSSLSKIKVLFRNDETAETVIGSEGGFAKLSIDEKENTLATQLVVGIDGTYKYSLSKDRNTLTLENNDGAITLSRTEYNMVPKAPKNPKLDKKLFGWWRNTGGITYYFGKDGRMYTNMITTETYYTYSASKGKIDAVYDYDGDMETSMSYSFKNDKLTVDGIECEKIK